MTAQTGLAVVRVTALFSMFIIHPRLFMLVTVSARELIVVAGSMAFGTVFVVGSPDGETVIESGLVPGSVARAMAVLARRRKTGRDVIGTPRAAIVVGMTTIAIGWQVVSRAVANLTIEVPMGPFQTKHAIVIERRALPPVGRSAMARLTIGPESPLLMVWVPRAIVVVTMTGDAVGWRAGVPVVGMALSAIRRPVLSLKPKGSVVVERGTLPTVRRGTVTRLAVGTKTGLLMIGIGSSIVVVPVASDAVGRRAGVPVVEMA